MKTIRNLTATLIMLIPILIVIQSYAETPFSNVMFISSQVPLTDEQGNILPGNSPYSPVHINGALIQLVNPGTNGIIDSCDDSGTPSGDDVLISSFAIGDGVPVDQGEKGLFYALLSGGSFPGANVSFYVRIFNKSTCQDSTYYGVTAIVSLASLKTIGSWWYFDVNKYGLLSTNIPVGSLPVGHPPIASKDARLISVSQLTEGETIQLSVQGITDSDSNTLTYAWDLDGNGVFDDAVIPAPTITWSDDTTLTIGVKVTDDNGNSSVLLQQIVVRNCKPITDMIGNLSASRDELLSIPFQFSDPGVFDTHSVLINWGDGVFEQMNNFSGNSLLHSFFKSGQYTVVIMIRDDDGGTERIEVSVSIIPLPLLVQALLNSDGDVLLKWNAEPDSTYEIFFTDDLRNNAWQILEIVSGDTILDSGDDNGYDNVQGTSDDRVPPVSVNTRFYRVQMK
ncbi:MAG: PKD domain-containing protein [Candidatus Auribacterota bacterium]